MKPILTPQQMKQADDTAIGRLHIPSLRLMEHAGLAVARQIETLTHSRTHATNKKRTLHVLVLCGKGNNGGDGFVTARLLCESGFEVTAGLIESARQLTGDAAVQFRMMKQCKGTVHVVPVKRIIGPGSRGRFDVIVDAMLGISYRGVLQGSYRTAVEWCNQQKCVKIAVDIPTGLNGETGEVVTAAFRADRTVTMSSPKSGFFLGRAKEYTGEIVIADIGIPVKALPSSNLYLTERSDVQRTFPKRAVNSHKHSVGKVFILAGSRSMSGAALLCSLSSMRSGAGQVILGIPESEYPVVARRSMEVMPLPLPSTADGSVALTALSEIHARLRWCDVLLIGCGLSRNEETQLLIRTVIHSCEKPMVIDADALSALAGHLHLLSKKGNVVLTPHMGEFSRLTGMPAEEIERNKFALAAKFSRTHKVTLILKGAPTVVADERGKVFVNPTGNPGMSTAGSGDVLAGIVASLTGQGNPVFDAAVNGTYLHGEAGDSAAEKIGMHGMIAGDIVRHLPAAIRKVITS